MTRKYKEVPHRRRSPEEYEASPKEALEESVRAKEREERRQEILQSTTETILRIELVISG